MKNIIKDERSAEEVARVISNTMERNVDKVKDVLDLDLNDLIEIVERLDKEKQEQVLSIMINKSLEELKSITLEDYQSVSRDVDEVTDYFASKKEEFDAVIEEGDYIANQMLYKVIGVNDRKISLPLDISIIKEYCFSSELKEEQFHDALMWIALRYIGISKCLKWQKSE